MKCDKCGFEHNSRSVCPKCGARVIYVNEDYLKRREEWKKSHQNGTSDIGSLPGIRYSTREDYDKRHGNDTITNFEHYDTKKEGRPEKKGSGLSFAVILAHIIVFFKNHKPQRKQKEEPNAIISHKIFKDKRKYIFIGVGVVIFAAIFLIIILNVIKNADHTKVIIEDNTGVHYANGKMLIEGPNVKCAYKNEGTSVYFDDDTLYRIVNGNVDSIAAFVTSVITCSSNAQMVVYSGSGGVCVTDFNNIHTLDIDKNQSLTNNCMTSDNGKYFVITTSEASDDFSLGTYSMYYGDLMGNTTCISKDNEAKEIINVTDDGSVIYYGMDEADYGVINGRSIYMYDGSVHILADNIEMSVYSAKNKTIYYIDGQEKLCQIDFSGNNQKILDYEAVSFVENVLSPEQIIYRNSSGLNVVNGEDMVFLAGTDAENVTAYYDDSKKYFYFTGDDELYYVSEKGGKVRNLGKIKNMLNNSKSDILLALLDEGSILMLDDKQETYKEKADEIYIADNYQGFVYKSGSGIYAVPKFNRKSRKIYEGEIINQGIIYSHRNFYLKDDNDTLHTISSNGKKDTSIGETDDFYLIK